jgi:hypothetical protein
MCNAGGNDDVPVEKWQEMDFLNDDEIPQRAGIRDYDRGRYCPEASNSS